MSRACPTDCPIAHEEGNAQRNAGLANHVDDRCTVANAWGSDDDAIAIMSQREADADTREQHAASTPVA